MSFIKKNQKNGSVFVENFGATEPVSGGGMTEKLNDVISPYGGTVGPTETAPNGGLIDFELMNGGNPTPVVIEEYAHTQPAYSVNVVNAVETIAPVVGWLVCIKGPNAGKEFRIHSDYNYVGSQKGDIIIPNDPKISREHHMIITYDPTDRNFYVAPASGANIIRLNDKALIGGGQQLSNYDTIKTGDSTFMFIAFCGEKFGWDNVNE